MHVFFLFAGISVSDRSAMATSAEDRSRHVSAHQRKTDGQVMRKQGCNTARMRPHASSSELPSPFVENDLYGWKVCSDHCGTNSDQNRTTKSSGRPLRPHQRKTALTTSAEDRSRWFLFFYFRSMNRTKSLHASASPRFSPMPPRFSRFSSSYSVPSSSSYCSTQLSKNVSASMRIFRASSSEIISGGGQRL